MSALPSATPASAFWAAVAVNGANGQEHLLLHIGIRLRLEKLRQHRQGRRLAGQGLNGGKPELLRIGLIGRNLAEDCHR